GLKVPSLNRETLKIEWKSVTAVMKKRAPVIEVNTSLTGRQRNTLKLTPDHKMIALENRQLVDVQMQDLLNTQRHVVLAHYIPEITSSTQREQRSAYLLGALSTDGHVRWNTRHGEVTFVQKPTPEKEAFIAQVTRTMQTEFKKDPLIREKPISQGIIRGKPAHGSANSYRWFGKLMAEEVIAQQQQFVTTLLTADQEVALQFLGGVIDGDGTYNAKAHRVSIYCSKEWLLESIIVACLRIGIVPQVSKNRTVANVQLVEKLDLIGHYTHRIHITGKRERIGTRFFAAREVVGDIIDRVNVDGRIKPYVNSNLLISEERLQSLLGKMTKNEQEHVARLLASDIRQQRVTFERELGEQDVYNITVADHHNYIVFTDRYSPILVNNCHAAIVSRELGIPCVVGTNDGTEKIRNGRPITVSCAEGEDGLVYDGILKFERKVVDASRLAKPKTKVMMNVGNPDEAFELSFIPNDGVGLAREEFIITNSIKIHPLALIHFDHITEPKLRAQIEEMTRGYPNKTDFFVEKLAQGVATIAAAFYPKDVIVRMSDFKSNEYAGLIGGLMFEPKEDNPMIGWRGASRYYKPGYEEGFALECKAMKKVRDDMGLTNVKIMIPFCRTVDEGRKVLAVMAKHGLVRHKNGLQVYVMCEIPANVVLAEQFADIFDGFSIGSNDLTQLTLGVDRDSELVADVYDERNAAVKTLIAHVIRVCKKLHRKIGICGQAPSDYPDFAQFLVREGIDSISLNPDSVMRTIPKILAIERKR
ncbi:MAG TPA: putative PEP-binding protein, partial [Candidatus Binatia bacterium]|nr:putative PEP-binding protein [Candidatus Binatia bacterium]